MIHLATSSSQTTGPPPGFWWYWADIEDLPDGQGWPKGEAAYTEHLAGKPADETLDRLWLVLLALHS